MPEVNRPRGDKSSYGSKQKRQAEHIEEGYEKRGVSKKTAQKRAWANSPEEEAPDHARAPRIARRLQGPEPGYCRKLGDKKARALQAFDPTSVRCGTEPGVAKPLGHAEGGTRKAFHGVSRHATEEP